MQIQTVPEQEKTVDLSKLQTNPPVRFNDEVAVFLLFLVNNAQMNMIPHDASSHVMIHEQFNKTSVNNNPEHIQSMQLYYKFWTWIYICKKNIYLKKLINELCRLWNNFLNFHRYLHNDELNARFHMGISKYDVRTTYVILNSS